jgi:multicomponent Na+:H+ antiporter subunit G
MTELFNWLVLLISSLCLMAGAFFSIVGGWGLVKLPEFYSRIHSGGVTDTAGAGLILIGLMIESGFNLASAKLAMILFFFIMTTPSACHVLAKSALESNVPPQLDVDSNKTTR